MSRLFRLSKSKNVDVNAVLAELDTKCLRQHLLGCDRQNVSTSKYKNVALDILWPTQNYICFDVFRQRTFVFSLTNCVLDEHFKC